MSSVQLTRVVPKMFGRSDKAISVAFTDRNGKVVSLAFDDRFDFEDGDFDTDTMTYGVWNDCPVIDGNCVQMQDSRPEAIMRNLRDALNNLDLGDDDDK